jgi:hypothetical protein
MLGLKRRLWQIRAAYNFFLKETCRSGAVFTLFVFQKCKNFCVGTEGIMVLNPNDVRSPPNRLFIYVHCEYVYLINQRNRELCNRRIKNFNSSSPPRNFTVGSVVLTQPNFLHFLNIAIHLCRGVAGQANNCIADYNAHAQVKISFARGKNIKLWSP